jgi:hypothetical protein
MNERIQVTLLRNINKPMLSVATCISKSEQKLKGRRRSQNSVPTQSRYIRAGHPEGTKLEKKRV